MCMYVIYVMGLQTTLFLCICAGRKKGKEFNKHYVNKQVILIQ